MAVKRTDRVGSNRTQFEKNARYIYRTQEICGICGLPVDKDLKSPDPMSKTIDHIIPVSKGGHPSDLANLQLAHRCCNRQKGDKLFTPGMLNNRGIQNNPGSLNSPPPFSDSGQVKAADPEQNDGHANDQQKPAIDPQNKQPGSFQPQILKRQVDNDNLPQHADWSAYAW